MGLDYRCAELIVDFFRHKQNEEKKSVMEIGSQEIFQHDFELFDSLYDALGYIPNIIDGDKRSTKHLYSAIGFNKYVSIDLYEDAKDNIKFDLNYDFDKRELFGSFDFIYNGGTSEHIFNQLSVFRNIHRFCRNGGLMLHMVPMQGHYNHGFYNYNPMFFYGLAKYNGYSIEGMWIYEHTTNQMLFYNISSVRVLLDILKIVRNSVQGLLLYVLLKKQRTDDFVIPQQDLSYFYKIDEIIDLFSKNARSDRFIASYGQNIHRGAIFGSAKAGEIAFEICSRYGIEVVCFIDDYKKGFHMGVEIVSYDEFLEKYYDKVDAILLGPSQKGNIRERAEIKKPIVDIIANISI